MPKRPSKPPPLPSPRTAQQPNAMSGAELARMLTGRGAGPLSLLAPTPMVVRPRGEGQMNKQIIFAIGAFTIAIASNAHAQSLNQRDQIEQIQREQEQIRRDMEYQKEQLQFQRIEMEEELRRQQRQQQSDHLWNDFFGRR